MRHHEWTWLAVAAGPAATDGSGSALLIGVCKACGTVRTLTVGDGRDVRFDVTGDCRTTQEQADERRRAY
jgi:hypothetical protein